jgi:hypothetical protein
MREGRESAPVIEARLNESLRERAIEAALEGPRRDRIRNGLEGVIDAAEANPDAARAAVWALARDRATLERLERCLDTDTKRATLALGAAMQIARAELASPAPDLRSRMPELLRWLEGDW